MKVYVKPELRFESFVLSQTVAECGFQLNGSDINTCKVINDRYSFGAAENAFAVTPNVCDFETDFYCYTNGSDGFPKTFCS